MMMVPPDHGVARQTMGYYKDYLEEPLEGECLTTVCLFNSLGAPLWQWHTPEEQTPSPLHPLRHGSLSLKNSLTSLCACMD